MKRTRFSEEQVIGVLKEALAGGKTADLIWRKGYREEQLAYGTGGPPNIENLYTEEGLRRAFSKWEIELLHSYDAEIEEALAIRINRRLWS